jgi:hypothetical protein
MSWFVTIEVENEDKAKFLVADTQETESMCVINTDGDEVEFNVLSIQATQRIE